MYCSVCGSERHPKVCDSCLNKDKNPPTPPIPPKTRHVNESNNAGEKELEPKTEVMYLAYCIRMLCDAMSMQAENTANVVEGQCWVPNRMIPVPLTYDEWMKK